MRKVIIFILLLAGVAGAQEVVRCDELKIYRPSVCTLRSYYGPIANILSIPKDTLAYRTHQITVGELEDYLKDSTAATEDTVFVWIPSNSYATAGPKLVRRKQKKTLSGLLAWYQNKYKEELP